MKDERFLSENSEEYYPDILYQSSEEDQELLHHRILTKSPSFPKTERRSSIDVFINIRDKNKYERLEETSSFTHGYLNCMRRLHWSMTDLCLLIISSSVFEFIIISVILLNIFSLALEDPMSVDQDEVLEKIDMACLYIYTIEAGLKIGGLGLVSGKDSYLRDSWNILDFIIVTTAWIERTAQEGVNLSALRTLRVLRPLRSISSIHGLKVLIVAIINSIKPLLLSLIVFVFFMSIFAIAGLQIWMGDFRMRCVQVNSGEILENFVCGECPVGYKCTKGVVNLLTVHYDDFFHALLTIFNCITLEGWNGIMLHNQTSFSPYAFLYYIPLVFIGAFLFLNFTLAVIKSSFSKEMDKFREKEKQNTQSGFTGSRSSLKENNRNDNYNTQIESYAENDDSKQSEYSDESESMLSPNFIEFKMKEPRDNMIEDSPTKDKETLFSLLTRRENVKMEKAVYSKINKEEGLDNCVISLKDDMDFSSNSHLDVCPSEKILTSRANRVFTYITDRLLADERFYEREINKKSFLSKFSDSHFNIFSSFAIRVQFIKAFGLVQGLSQDAIQEVLMVDEITKEVLGEWSGMNINPSKSPDKYITDLSDMEFRIWGKGWKGMVDKVCFICSVIIDHRAFSSSMTACVIINTIVLALDHHGISEDFQTALNTINLFFSGVFLLEMLVKLLGMGFLEYFSDFMNYLDASVVILSCIEIVFLSGDSALTAFRTFRVFRVLRVARLFRYMESMAEIMRVLSASIYNFVYLALLLLVFILIFSLLGMQSFGGKFNFKEGTPRANFDNFHNAFVTVFQILTLENWHLILYDGMRSERGEISSLFFVFWILIGNFVLLNLFLAILLDSFSQEEGKLMQNRTDPGISKANTLEIKDKSNIEFDTLHFAERDDEEEAIDETYCKRSYYLFPRDNKVRVFCHKIAHSPAFEHAILFLISLSSLKLVWDTYLLDEPSDSDLILTSWVLDIIFTICFALEFLLKSISIGLLMHSRSYMRDRWNMLDFGIIFISLLELAVQGIDIPYIKILRLLRTLRPLRFITHNTSMRLVATALLESFCAILNVVIVLLIVWLIFAILGVSLFSGKFYTCEDSAILRQDKCEDFGYSWQNASTNFDNVPQAMITLLIVSSLEGWPQIMELGVDAKAVGEAPVRDYNPAVAYFFILFILIGSFFFINFFIGVIFMQFNLAKLNEASAYACFLTKNQQKWLEMQDLILLSKPRLEAKKPHSNAWRKAMHKICKSPIFDSIILCCLLLNMLVLALPYEDASNDYIEALEKTNLVFAVIFMAECGIKLTGLGFRVYFSSKWNSFELLVVVMSIVEISINYIYFDSGLMVSGSTRVFRLLRVSRLIRVFKDLKTLQQLIRIMVYSLNAILNVLSLLFLIFFIYAILGVFIFHHVPRSEVIDTYNNFENWGMAMLILFRVSTGEDWQVIMHECADSVGFTVAVLYFSSFIVITMFIMLNLFIMVIVQTYEDYENDPQNTLQLFTADTKKFKKVWGKHAMTYGGVKIYYNELPDLLRTLGHTDDKLGIHPDVGYEKALKILSTMDLFIDQNGYVFYNDILYAVLKKKYIWERNINQCSKKILKRERKTMKKKLGKIRSNADACRQDLRKNLFITLVYARAIFKAWRSWALRRVAFGSSRSVTPADSEVEFPGFNSPNCSYT